MGRILGIPVRADLISAWRGWLAPDLQPFFVDDESEWPERRHVSGELTPELRDTYKVWRFSHNGDVVWLDEASFTALDRRRRRRLVRGQALVGRGAVPTVQRWGDLLDGRFLRHQADGHRFVWWPSLVARAPELILGRFAADEGDKTRHRTVSPSTWRRCAAVLPGARDLAGTFAEGSGSNCFGTVMAAAGVPGAAGEWMQQAPFDEWLKTSCVPGGNDEEAGTVLVWRESSGLPVHAAVTIGDGYALEKPAQTWWTPRIAGTVAEVKRASRATGQRLERHHIPLPHRR